jgi:hypothetical protein
MPKDGQSVVLEIELGLQEIRHGELMGVTPEEGDFAYGGVQLK